MRYSQKRNNRIPREAKNNFLPTKIQQRKRSRTSKQHRNQQRREPSSRSQGQQTLPHRSILNRATRQQQP